MKGPKLRLRGVCVSKRLPSPGDPKRPACVVDDAELQALERLAAEVRLSVSSMIRVLIVWCAAHPEHAEEWKAVAERIAKALPPERKKPGRPAKGKKSGTG